MIFLEKQPLSKLFNNFITKNKFDNMTQALEYFAVFGGTNFSINTKYSLEITIENYILNKYKYLRDDINQLTTNNEAFYPILTGLALGDRRTNSAFKRANIKLSTISKAQMSSKIALIISYVRAYKRDLVLHKIFESGMKITVCGKGWQDIVEKYNNIDYVGSFPVSDASFLKNGGRESKSACYYQALSL